MGKKKLQHPISDFYFQPGLSIVFLGSHYLILIRLQLDNRRKEVTGKISNGTLQVFFSPTLYVGLFTLPPVKFILISCKIDWGQIKKSMHWRNTSPDDRKDSAWYILFTMTQFQQRKTWVFRPFSGNRKCKISGASRGFVPRTPTKALPWTHWGAYGAPRPPASFGNDLRSQHMFPFFE